MSSYSNSNLPQHWFFFRGLAREASHWGSFPKKFAERLPRAQVHCINLPGTGTAHAERSPIRLALVADYLRNKMQAIEEEFRIPPEAERFALGMSLGAMTLVHWLHQHPKDFRGAVLINPSLRGFSPWYRRLSPSTYWELAKSVLSKDPKTRERHILSVTSQVRSWSEKDLEELASLARRHPLSYGNFFRQLVAGATDSPPREKPKVPLLILNSLGDELVHPNCSIDIQKRWSVPVKRHAWAGHDLPLDDPDWTVEAIRSWLLEQKFGSFPLSESATK